MNLVQKNAMWYKRFYGFGIHCFQIHASLAEIGNIGVTGFTMWK